MLEIGILRRQDDARSLMASVKEVIGMEFFKMIGCW